MGRWLVAVVPWYYAGRDMKTSGPPRGEGDICSNLDLVKTGNLLYVIASAVYLQFSFTNIIIPATRVLGNKSLQHQQ